MQPKPGDSPRCVNRAIQWLSAAVVVAVVAGTIAEAQNASSSTSRSSGVEVQVRRRTVRVPVVEGTDVRFRRLSTAAGLSQTRVEQIVQDDQGFMWFGTQFGLNRYDGNDFRVFTPDPANANSLSCGSIGALFKDRSNKLWIGCNQFLDRFDPTTEQFVHYRLTSRDSDSIPVTVHNILQDRAGVLWLGTGSGLYGLDSTTGRILHRYTHDPANASSLTQNEIKPITVDGSGRLLVADGNDLEQFDQKTGTVVWRLPLPGVTDVFSSVPAGAGATLPSSRPGTFLWIDYTTNWEDGGLALLNSDASQLTYYSFYDQKSGKTLHLSVSAMIDEANGSFWLGGNGGLLRFEPEAGRAIRYRHHPDDPESLDDDRVIALEQDREGNIWVGLHAREPNVFATRKPSFAPILRETLVRNPLGEYMVSAIYEDRGALWVGASGNLIRADRTTGKYTSYPLNDDVISITGDSAGAIWVGTGYKGLYQFVPQTGRFTNFPLDPSPSAAYHNQIVRIFIDRTGVMWLATRRGVQRFDRATGRFTVYKRSQTDEYYDVADDQNGRFWLGGNGGLQLFDPATGQFTAYEHQLDNPRSLSDNTVSSVLVDHSGAVWAATYNGLAKLDQKSGKFTNYYANDGLPSSRVSCVLEDGHNALWLSTTRGVSRFDPIAKTFRNYSIADGLPGMDLTGWVTCFKSSSGEMFFGGFSGATAFFPDKVVDSEYVPPVVFTDFQLSGRTVNIGDDGPLQHSISYTKRITLPHEQNDFSLQFAALTFSSPLTVRYRYRLDSFDSEWRESGAGRRFVNYPKLAPGKYTFRVEASTGHRAWNPPGATLYIEILPPWWSTWWFRVASAIAVSLLLWELYQLRIRQLRRQETKLRNVIETVPIFAWTASPDGAVDFVNRHWVRFTGMSTATTVGSGWYDAVHPDNRKEHAEKWRMSMTSGEPFEGEVRYRGADGKFRWFLARAVPMRDARGKIVKWYGTSTDIEDRKRAEQLQADLAHVNRVSMLGEMAASLAHEIKQPLAAAITSANSCAQWLAHEPPNLDRARAAATRIDQYGNRATEIIDRMRSFYTKSPQKRDLVDVNEITEEILMLLKGQAAQQSVFIRTELAAGLPKIKADQVQLQQVFMNLVLNAIEAMQDQGGVLTVKSELVDSQLLLSVADTGVGLPTDKVDQIFSAFFTTKSHGSGMGLPISRSIVESHGGRLWATANEGPGTIFQFTLPIEGLERAPLA